MAVVLVVAVMGAWAEVRLRRMPTLYHLKRDGLNAAAASAQVLILGASQANQGLDPAQWPVPAYNAACVAQDAYYDLEMFDTWLPRMPALKSLVLAVSYVSLGSTLADTAETWRSFAYSQSFGFTNELPSLRWDLRNWSALALSEPWAALQLARAGFVDPHAVSLTALGYQAIAPMGEEQIELRINGLTASKRMRYHQSVMKPENVAINTAYYKTMLTQADVRGLKVYLVIFPVDVSYAQAVPAEDLERRREQLYGLMQGTSAKVLDYFRDQRFKTKDFDDVDHMNSDGARKFSQILWKEALKD